MLKESILKGIKLPPLYALVLYLNFVPFVPLLHLSYAKIFSSAYNSYIKVTKPRFLCL